jgi:DNA-nicking Smr family endonuclease
MEIDLHGYDPRQIVETDTLAKMVQQAWEMGEPYLRLIHGHGRMRGISPQGPMVAKSLRYLLTDPSVGL